MKPIKIPTIVTPKIPRREEKCVLIEKLVLAFKWLLKNWIHIKCRKKCFEGRF